MSLHLKWAMSDHFGRSPRFSGESLTRGARLSNPSPLSKVSSNVATGSSFVCRTTPRCTRWVMSCHTPWRLTRTLTALRRGGWYMGLPGTMARTPLVVSDGMSDTPAPPLLLRRPRRRHVIRRAGLLRHVPQGLPVRLPLFPCGAHRNRSVREHDPVGLRQAAVALLAKRGPRLGLPFLLDLLLRFPTQRRLVWRPVHHRTSSRFVHNARHSSSACWYASGVS